ncbi:hypothetical protein MGYG_04513 [Nannizzia gypsea CBS 118893]|uniref:Uncharacterized protein n=1 Tax=Arthroderma gypseum (strain ATCC MYA-4604 / CBS 118893) TaxID=535722 RepID=E4UTG0_ARTGP|nr:hypothetical protein MGYG_04513 [Nannizzia gypsea CBS 118893]EFR01505.1 hypothetical protein MGYG_04513 [Nannizzia gypsea CBS 118893]
MFDISGAHAELDTIHQIQNALVERLKQERAKGPRAISAAVDNGMTYLFNLAVFVHTNFNSQVGSVGPTPPSKALFQNVRASFQQVQQTTMGTLDDLSRIQAESVDLSSTRVAKLLAKVQEAKKSTEITLKDLGARIEEASKQEQTWEAQVKQNEELLQTAEEKLRSDEEAQRDTNIGLSILIPFWGIAGLIDHRAAPGNVLLASAVGAQKQALQDADNSLMSTRNYLIQTQKEEADYRNETAQLDVLTAQLQNMTSSITVTAGNINDMVQATGKMKENAAQMVQLANKMYNDATIASGDAFFRDEFVNPILDLCSLVVIEFNAAPKIDTILDELKNAYGENPIPQSINQKFEDIRARVKRFLPPTRK